MISKRRSKGRVVTFKKTVKKNIVEYTFLTWSIKHNLTDKSATVYDRGRYVHKFLALKSAITYVIDTTFKS